MSVDEYVDELTAKDHVHDAVAIDETTVAAIKKQDMNDDPEVFTNENWRVALRVNDDSGDVLLFRKVNR